MSAFVMGDHHSVLVLASSGQLLEGLQILLRATPSVELLGCLVDGELTAEMLQSGAPDVLLIDDAILGEDIHTALGQITDAWPGTRYIVLAEDVERKQIIDSIGTIETLLKGSPAEHFFKAILGSGNRDVKGM